MDANTFFEELFDMLPDLFGSADSSLALAEMGIAGIILLVALITAVISIIFSLVIYVVEAIPTYILARKAKRPLAWLAWIPFFGSYCRLFVLADIPGNKPFVALTDKITIKSRPLSFLAYVGIKLLGPSVITAFIALANLVPFIGQVVGTLSSVLYLVPAVALAIMEYVYLKDVLDVFKEDKKANSTASLVVTLLDSFITFGFARVIYLYTLLKKEPIESTYSEPIEVSVNNTAN
ncbi:MAG: hypothetical protein Q4D44_04130 [Eubacteriales bacterium]|nr:hypothetical protein [Eubacteriales bacterium]